MGQLILFLLGLFTIGCVLYGIAAGVRLIQCGLAYLTKSERKQTPSKKSCVTPLSPAMEKTSGPSTAQTEVLAPAGMQTEASTNAGVSPIQHSIGELRDIFSLYQQGALTQDEFESMKQCLLNGVKQQCKSDTQKKE